MALSPKAGIAETSVKLADLFSKVSELAKQEDKEVARIVGTILPVLSWLNEPVKLHPESLGETFREMREASLQIGARVVMADERGKTFSRALAKFSVEDCLAILQDCFPELQKQVADKRRAEKVKPTLSMRMILRGCNFLVDLRSYHLEISNSGEVCRDIRVLGLYPEGRTKTLGPVDVDGENQAELNLGVFKEVHGLGHLDLRIECKDVDGRELKAQESVRLDGEEWQTIALRKA